MKTIGFLAALLIAGNCFAQTSAQVNFGSDSETGDFQFDNTAPAAEFSTNTEFNFISHVKTKTFSKTYNTNAVKQLNLTNKYGPVEIKVWNKNEIKADIVMKATSDNEKDAITLLNGVELEEKQSSEMISIKTLLEIPKGKFGTSIRNGKIMWKREVNISYVIYMPASLALSVNAQYGNVQLEDFNGPTNLKVQYGSLTAGDLNNANNQISVQYGSTTIGNLNKGSVSQQYGKGVTIANSNDLNLNVQYAAANIVSIKNKAVVKVQYGGGLSIGSVGSLNLSAQYASVKIGSIKGDATINQQYNSLSLGSVSTLTLVSQYTNVTVEELNGNANIKSTYNNLNIGTIKPSAKSLLIVASYVNVGLGFDAAYKGNIEALGRYSGFSGPSSIRKVRDESNSKAYQGTIGGGGSNEVSVNTQYGKLAIK